MKTILPSLLALVVAAPASAMIFQSNYTPSQGDPTFVNSDFPFAYRAKEDPANFSTDFAGSYAIINVFNTAFHTSAPWTEFVATRSFTASHVTFPQEFIFSWNNQNRRMQINLDRWDSETEAWENVTTGQYHVNLLPKNTPLDVTVPFGTNATGSFGGFQQFYGDVVEGEKYRIGFGYAVGASGHHNWFTSFAPAAEGQTYANLFNANNFTSSTQMFDHQLAFALSDGDITAAVPEPAALLSVISGLLLAGVAILRRKR